MSQLSKKGDQILTLDPKNELHFKGPFNEVVTSYLKLINPSDSRVCFKVKTTAPKRYCVRPNNGIVEPKQAAQIAVMLQPFDVDNQAEKNKHKFMVQTMIAPEGDVNQENLWKDATPDAIMDSKLKCVFDYPSQPPAGRATSDDVSYVSEPAETAKPPGSPNVSKTKEHSSPSNMSTDARKIQDENKRLRDELTHIRQENMQLKEEGLRQRIKHGGGQSSSGTTSADLVAQQKLAGAGLQAQQQDVMALLLNPNVLAIGLVLFIAGLLAGKVIF